MEIPNSHSTTNGHNSLQNKTCHQTKNHYIQKSTNAKGHANAEYTSEDTSGRYDYAITKMMTANEPKPKLKHEKINPSPGSKTNEGKVEVKETNKTKRAPSQDRML